MNFVGVFFLAFIEKIIGNILILTEPQELPDKTSWNKYLVAIFFN